MKYIGSKNRISKYIVPIIQKVIDDNDIKVYYEPFVGGANLIDKIQCEKRIGNDIHKELIALWQALQNGYIPPSTITEDEYNKVKNNKQDYPDYYVGLVGFCATFGSKYFGGYARGFKADGVTERNIPNEAIRNIMKQVPDILDVEFLCSDYRNNKYNNISNAAIYCDPPYATKERYYEGEFDSNEFWDWCREKSKNNVLFVSEYNAPLDFQCIWEKQQKTFLDVANPTERTERLYIHNSCLEKINFIQ